MKRRALLVLGWAWAAGIVWLSLTPSPPEIDFQDSDKLGHLLSYAMLMLCFVLAYRGWRARLAHALLFLAMGVGIEFAQAALGYRMFEGLDMLANAAGIGLGWAAGHALSPLAPRLNP